MAQKFLEGQTVTSLIVRRHGESSGEWSGRFWKVLEGQIGSMEYRVQDGKPQRPVWTGVTSDQDGLARHQGCLAGSWPICEHRGAGDSPLGCVPV